MPKQMRLLSAVVAMLAMAAIGCTRNADNAVIAKVNSKKITAGDFKQQMDGLDNMQLQMQVASDPDARKNFLDDLIGIELVVQEAKRLGLDKDPEFKKRQETMRRDMERQVRSALRNELFRSVLKKELSDKLGKIEQPTDKDVKEFYNKNQEKMRDQTGKRLSLKEVGPRLREVIAQNKQRDIYLEYTKGLKEKAKISVDEKALENVFASDAELTATKKPAEPSAEPSKKDDAPEN